MPQYNYKCSSCGNITEDIRKESEKDDDCSCEFCKGMIQGKRDRIMCSTFFTGHKQKGKYNSLG
jgi:putative FmdB family regulatory protein